MILYESYDFSVFKKLRIQKVLLPNYYKKVSFSNCSNLESVFKKFRFRGSFYADTSVLVWTEGVSVTIKLPFQIYPT